VDGFRRRVRFDRLDWSVLALAAAWLVAALATPNGSPAALGAAFPRVVSALLFVFSRNLFTPVRRKNVLLALWVSGMAVLAWTTAGFLFPALPRSAAFAGSADIAAFMAICLCAAISLLPAGRRKIAAVAAVAIPLAVLAAAVTANHPPAWGWLAGRPLLGWGPGGPVMTPLWAALPKEGGIVACLAAAALAWFLLHALLAMFRRKPRVPEAVAAAGVAASLLAAGFIFNPFACRPCLLAGAIALAVLIPPVGGKGR
jgi:hypothetical protein